jgi:ABC-type transporter MlaC component
MRLFLILGIWFSLFWVADSAPASAGEAASTVMGLLDRAMEIQTRPDLHGEAKRAERTKLIRHLIVNNFAISEMARETVSESWDQLNPQQRSEFQTLFSDLLQDFYTRMVLNFLQQENIEHPQEDAASAGIQVRTSIVRDRKRIPVTYHLVRKSSRWLIRDLEFDDVSIVKNYQDTFYRLIASGSFEALLKEMRLQRLAIENRSSG